MTTIEKINDFLTEAKVFYLATVDGAQPKCRPIGLHVILDGQLYFGVGTFKECYKQMQANPQVEICATIERDFLRCYGKAVFQPELEQRVLDHAPHLRAIYNEETGNHLGVFCLTEATAEFRSMMAVKESLKF